VDPDGRKSGFVTKKGAVAGAGHSGMWVDLYDQSGNVIGCAFFEVNPIDENAYAIHGGEPLEKWMAILGGSMGGSSVGSSVAGSTGSSVGSSAGSTTGDIVNEAAVRVGVNEYRFYTSEGIDAKEKMNKFIANRWFKDETATGKIRQTVLSTSKAQDLLILEAAILGGDSFGRYDISSNNCAQYVSRTLSVGGVNTSSQAIPNRSHDYIDRNNRDLIEK